MNKYNFKTFDKVLGRDEDTATWYGDIFIEYREDDYPYLCIGSNWKECIPYEGNEELLGTDKEPITTKWKPRDKDIFYAPRYSFYEHFVTMQYEWTNGRECNELYERGWVCRSEKECRELRDKLNKAIKEVKNE